MAFSLLGLGLGELLGIGGFLSGLFGGGPEASDFPQLQRKATAEADLLENRRDLVQDLLGEGRQQRIDQQQFLDALLSELEGGFSFAAGGLDVPFDSRNAFSEASNNHSLLPDRMFFDRLLQIAQLTGNQGNSAETLASLLQQGGQRAGASLGAAGSNILNQFALRQFMDDIGRQFEAEQFLGEFQDAFVDPVNDVLGSIF